MRIRNRSGALFTSTSYIASNTSHGNGEDEFLLPLVAAVMNVQRAEEKEVEGDHGTHTRPAHNWRNSLHLQLSGDGNSEGQVLKDGAELKKANCRWKESMKYISISESSGTQEALPKEDTSSSVEKEMMGSRDEEWKLPKPGGLEMGILCRQQKFLSVHGVKRKRSKSVIGNIIEWKHERNITKGIGLESDIQQEDGRKMDEKSMPLFRYNEAEGSQCRRRNGRGWRCSQRTLVGYSLCEYHLGKGRLRNIKTNNKKASRVRNNKKASTVIVNNKAGTCKLKELRLIDTA